MAVYQCMAVFLMFTGLVRQMEPSRLDQKPVTFGGGLQTNYLLPIPTLHEQVYRDRKLEDPSKPPKPESALFNFAWLTAPGTAVFLSALASQKADKAEQERRHKRRHGPS